MLLLTSRKLTCSINISIPSSQKVLSYIPPISELKRLLKYIGEIAITELDVFHVLRALDTSKAVGCDGISPKVLKHCALALYQPLYHLFSLSLTQHYLPVEWRTHLIKPIFKSGERGLGRGKNTGTGKTRNGKWRNGKREMGNGNGGKWQTRARTYSS